MSFFSNLFVINNLLSFSSLILVDPFSFSNDDSPSDSVSLQLLLVSWRAFFWIFFTLARWFWNHTCEQEMHIYICEWYLGKIINVRTCTILRLKPVSLARVSRTFRHGFGDTSKDALNARRCCVLSIVRGRFGPRRPSTFEGKTSSEK